jgi:hypothetical protein
MNVYYLYNSYLCIGHYRDLLTAQETVVLTETDNAWAAGEGIFSVEVNTTVPMAVYLWR